MADTTEDILKEEGLEEIGSESPHKIGIEEIATIRRKKSTLENIGEKFSDTAKGIQRKAIELEAETKPTRELLGKVHESYKEHKKKAREERLVDLEYRQKALTSEASIQKSQAQIQKIRNSMAQRQTSSNLFASQRGQQVSFERESTIWGGRAEIPLAFRAQSGNSVLIGGGHGEIPIAFRNQYQEKPKTEKKLMIFGNKQYVVDVPIKQKKEQFIPLAFRDTGQSSNSMLDFMGKSKKSKNWW